MSVDVQGVTGSSPVSSTNIVDENLMLYEFDNETLENPKVSTLTAVVGASRSTLETNYGKSIERFEKVQGKK